MRFLGCLVLLLTAGCDNEARSLERQYEILNKSGASAREKCDLARRVEQAWLVREDSAEWGRWRDKAGADCLDANIRDRLGYPF